MYSLSYLRSHVLEDSSSLCLRVLCQGADKFTYLRNGLSRAVHTDNELKLPKSYYLPLFGSPRGNVLQQNGINLDSSEMESTLTLKLNVFKSVVLVFNNIKQYSLLLAYMYVSLLCQKT